MHVIAVDTSSVHMCALMNGVQQPVHSAPKSSPQEIASGKSQSKAQINHPQIFRDYW